MKKRLLLSVIVLFSVYAGNLFAAPTPVNVFSNNFSVSGSISGSIWSDSDMCEQLFSDNYAQSGSVPLANSLTYGGFYDGASASNEAGFFYVSASAWGDGDSWGGASAVAELIFQPLLPINQFMIDYRGGLSGAASHGWWIGGIYLTDMTEGIPIFSQEVNYLNYLQFGAAGSYLIDHSFRTDHIYKLYLFTDVSSDYDTLYLNISTNDIRAVPEATTMLLLGLGLMGLAGIRKKFRN